MKIKTNSTVLAALFITAALAAQAQQQPDTMKNQQPPKLAGGPTPPPFGRHDKKPGPPHAAQEAVKLTTLSGIFDAAVANDRFEYNAFSLKTGGSEVTVNFPPHLGEQILNKAKSGSAVKVTGFYRNNPEGKSEFHFVNMDLNGSVIADAPPALPTTAIAQQQKTVTSVIKTLRRGRNNDVNGFELNSGEVVNIPPHIANQLSTQLKTGANVLVNGFIEPKRPGVVYSKEITIIKAQTLTLNGQAYLVR